MDTRNAWRLLDFTKDIFMHHRKFTPFQKLVFMSIFVGVLFCILRNLWFVWISITYGTMVYCSVTVSKYIIQRHEYLSSDFLLESFDRLEDFLKDLIENFNRNHKTNRQYMTDNNHQRNGSMSEDEDQFYDVPEIPEVPTTENKYSVTYLQKVNNNDMLLTETQVLTNLVHRDFIKSWYSLFSQNEEGLNEGEIILHNIFDNIQGRLHRANIFKMSKLVMLLFRNHIHEVKQAQMMFKVQSKRRRRSSLASTKLNQVVYKSVEECFASKFELHPALKSKELEQSYQKSILELVGLHILPEDFLESKSVICALKEILMCNLLQTIMTLLCDTTFLHERIIVITSDEVPGICKESAPIICVTESNPSNENVQSILSQTKMCSENSTVNLKKNDDNLLESKEQQLSCSPSSEKKNNAKVEIIETNNKTESKKVEAMSSEDVFHETKWKEDTELHPVSKGMCNECNRLCSKDKDKISPRPHSCSLGTSPVFFDLSQDSECASLNSVSSREGSPVFHSQEAPILTSSSCKSNIPNKSDIPITQDNVTASTDPVIDQTETTHSVSTPINIGMVETAEPAVEFGAKISSGNFFNRNFQNLLPNPLTSISNFRKRTSTSSSDGTPCSSETKDETEFLRDKLKISLSSGEITKDQASPTASPGAVTPTAGVSPSVFQDVRIISTESANEAGSNSVYTLYILQYEALYESDDAGLVHKSGTVKRRYSEFVNLQARLEDNYVYKKSMKNIKGPKKMFSPFPFGNMGKETLDSRRKLLETFLSSLLTRADICNGVEMKQFLGYGGDGHIAFVTTTHRIDQRLVKTMSGVFDKIVEGLPSLPQNLPRIISPFEEPQNDKEEEITQLDDTDDIEVEFVFHLGQKKAHQKMEASLDRFIEQQTCVLGENDIDTLNDTTLGMSILSWQEQQSPSKSSSQLTSATFSHMILPSHMTTSSGHMTSSSHMTTSSGHMTSSSHMTTSSGHMTSSSHMTSQLTVGTSDENNSTADEMSVAMDDCPLSNAVLDILTELLHGQDSWFCKDTVSHSTRIMLGKALNRFLEGKVKFLTSKEMNTFYLLTLRETVWPDGRLSDDARPNYTDHQREIIQKQASRCLAAFLPNILQSVLGQEDFDHIIEEVIQTIQYERLNRHFWYLVLDLIIEHVIPEVSSPELQRKLSGSVER